MDSSTTIEERLGKAGIWIPEILLPSGVNLRQWAAIACDQFTQDRAYWDKAKETAASSPSALNLIFPEVFLADDNPAGCIGDIHRTMREYLDSGVFAPPRRGFVYLERDTPFNCGRRGLVAAVDLEQYDWSPREPDDAEARPLIRPTEGTIADRLPPRMDIRRSAPLETPHILLLIDDDTDTLLRGLGQQAKKNAPVYQGNLMMNSGSASGWFLDSPEAWDFFAAGLEELARKALIRYPAGNAPGGQSATVSQPFLFAVGDGNHSLASAKGIWEEYKAKNGGGMNLPVHPCRYALVEIENIYDPAIRFEPIHRVVFGLDFGRAMDLFSALPGFSSSIVSGGDALTRLVAEPIQGSRYGIISGDRYALLETSAGGISTASLQPLLDAAISVDSSLSIDYIHGEDELFRLAEGGLDSGQGKATGILLPPVQKSGFFEAIACGGSLPRKSFSMGEAVEKRFYIECRKLFS
ncbi:MAG: DUF1015 domain-containing protein [Treponema sp.]|jgi:hypothetical protein|nr:DUF1015 domain-containing protein [Treponema sp.]